MPERHREPSDRQSQHCRQSKQVELSLDVRQRSGLWRWEGMHEDVGRFDSWSCSVEIFRIGVLDDDLPTGDWITNSTFSMFLLVVSIGGFFLVCIHPVFVFLLFRHLSVTLLFRGGSGLLGSRFVRPRIFRGIVLSRLLILLSMSRCSCILLSSILVGLLFVMLMLFPILGDSRDTMRGRPTKVTTSWCFGERRVLSKIRGHCTVRSDDSVHTHSIYLHRAQAAWPAQRVVLDLQDDFRLPSLMK